MSRKTSGSGTTEEGARDGVRAAMTPAQIAVLVLAVLALIFIFENTQTTDIRLLVPVVSMPLWAALLAMWLIGAVCGAYFVSRRRRRKATS
ncbi:LapA family protein [Streptomyces sp. NPDC057877]|uniref:LapA family protein n=1 Tax=Streptomyces sp. NPDC057877 TaxID=3346269 RepID=UPI00367A00CC